MGLIDELETPIDHGGTCKYQILHESLSDEEKQALDEALLKVAKDERASRAKQFSCEWLAQVLTRNGHPISRSTISRHLNEECNCAKL